MQTVPIFSRAVLNVSPVPSLTDSCLKKLLELNADGEAVNADFYNDLFLSCYADANETEDLLKTTLQKNALEYLANNSSEEKAALPILKDACEKYTQIIISGIHDLCEKMMFLRNSLKSPRPYLAKFTENKCRVLLNLIRLSQKEQLPQTTNERLLFMLLEVREVSLDYPFGPLDLSGKNLSGLDLSVVGGSKLSFKGSNLTNVVVKNGFMHNADFEKADLTGANFHDSFMDGANFCGAILNHTSFTKSSVKGAKYDRVMSMTKDTFSDAKYADTMILQE